MRWRRGGRSRNLEDRRGQRPRGGAFGGSLRIPLPRGRGVQVGGGRGMGLGGVVLLLLLLFILRDDPALLGEGRVGVPTGPDVMAGPGGGAGADPAEEEKAEFVSFVLDDLQATWARLLPGYRDARLVLFRGAVRSACGAAQSAMGPFYCPADGKVYIDLGFYDELRRRFGASGDFAEAYVLAHEIGHHVQTQNGVERSVRRLQQQRPGQSNQIQVRMELQADCLAGVWAHSTARRDLLDEGDLAEALEAAAAIGDDRIQEMSTGQIRPEAFTHGSSEQRMHWFRTGFERGDPEACDTFAR